jgi:hypothetical protein
MLSKIKIKLSRRQIASLFLAVLLLAVNSGMRYGVWKNMQSCNLDKTRLEKLALAYQLKGQAGLDYELGQMARHKASAGFAQLTVAQLKAAGDAGAFLKYSIALDREETKYLKAGRFWMSCLIFALLALQVLLNIVCWVKDNPQHFQGFWKK